MSPEDLAWLRASRATSGVPERVEDAATIERVALLARDGEREAA